MDFTTLAKIIYSLGISRIPGLVILLPYDALMAIVEAVEVGMEKKLRLDWKWSNWQGFIGFLKEATEAAMTSNKQDQVEAIYRLLEYVTNVEDYMSVDEFVKRVINSDAMALLPNGEVGNEPSFTDAILPERIMRVEGRIVNDLG